MFTHNVIFFLQNFPSTLLLFWIYTVFVPFIVSLSEPVTVAACCTCLSTTISSLWKATINQPTNKSAVMNISSDKSMNDFRTSVRSNSVSKQAHASDKENRKLKSNSICHTDKRTEKPQSNTHCSSSHMTWPTFHQRHSVSLQSALDWVCCYRTIIMSLKCKYQQILSTTRNKVTIHSFRLYL